jgi:hypothetical protein
LIRQPTTDVVSVERVDATNIGRLLATSGTADIIDAHVVVCARHSTQQVVTTDGMTSQPRSTPRRRHGLIPRSWHFEHVTKPGMVTIAGKPSSSAPIGTVRSTLKQRESNRVPAEQLSHHQAGTRQWLWCVGTGPPLLHRDGGRL